MIELKNITVRFGNNVVIHKLNLNLDKGITAICGPSGCGKTTLLRTLAGLQKYEGEIRGNENHKVAFAFQDYRLFSGLTVKENIDIVSASKDDTERVLKCMMAWDFAHKKPGELSGGMLSRVSLARALGYNADIILLDEPFAALDEALKETVAKNMLPYLKDKTVLLVTHNPADFKLLVPDNIITL